MKEVLTIIGVIGLALVGWRYDVWYIWFYSQLPKLYFHISLSTTSLIITLALAVDAILEPIVACLPDGNYAKATPASLS